MSQQWQLHSLPKSSSRAHHCPLLIDFILGGRTRTNRQKSAPQEDRTFENWENEIGCFGDSQDYLKNLSQDWMYFCVFTKFPLYLQRHRIRWRQSPWPNHIYQMRWTNKCIVITWYNGPMIIVHLGTARTQKKIFWLEQKHGSRLLKGNDIKFKRRPENCILGRCKNTDEGLEAQTQIEGRDEALSSLEGRARCWRRMEAKYGQAGQRGRHSSGDEELFPLMRKGLVLSQKRRCCWRLTSHVLHNDKLLESRKQFVSSHFTF